MVRLMHAEHITETQPKTNWDLEDFHAMQQSSHPIETESCTVLIGGTPYPPNSRLLNYLVPAAEIAHTNPGNTEKPQVILSSTATGGARWNYPGQGDQILRMTDIKQEIGKVGLEQFFGVEAIPHTVTDLPADPTLHKLWAIAREINPQACREYEDAADNFINKDQNPYAAGLYGVMHAIWAGDITLEGGETTQDINKTGITYGGSKEAAFNKVRHAVTEIGPELLTEIFGKQVQVRENIFRVVDPTYTAPVPYGEIRAKLIGKHVGPVDVRLAGQETIGQHTIDFDQTGPFDLLKPDKKISQLITDELNLLIERIAQANNLTPEQARKEYEEFWKQCQDAYGRQIHNILRNE